MNLLKYVLMNTIWLAFITGLTTGGISCFAVQGGLLASSLANQNGNNQKLKVASFLISKLVAYTILGAFLGALGASLIITPKIQGLMQIFAGLFMLATVGRLLELHPVFRRFAIQPPKFIFRYLRKTSKGGYAFSPILLGFLTVLIPCGITQSMLLLSVASGSALFGSLILASFVIGTSPVFFALGIASNQLLKRKSLRYAAASAIFILGILSINTGQNLRGSPHTLQNYWSVVTSNNNLTNNDNIAEVNAKGFQEVDIQVSNNGYKSSVKSLKKGVPVKLTLITNNTNGCSRAFTIPDYGISKILPQTGKETVEFTPNKTGRLVYTCSMGMYTGFFDII